MRQTFTNNMRAGACGLLAGLVGSLCCIGPSAAVLLGLGSSSALLGLSLDHSLALIGGVALLLSGVALALRHMRACDLRPAARWRTPALMLVTFALTYGLLGLLLPALAAQREDSSVAIARAPAAAALPRRLTLIVEKMNCPPCAARVRTALKRQPAVRAFVAEDGNEQISIDYDSRKIDAKQLTALFPPRYGVTMMSDNPLPASVNPL
jgi:hypothetical protein